MYTADDANVQHIARICHEANRAWCSGLGDNNHEPWQLMSQDVRDTTIRGVIAILKDPSTTPQESHDRWMKDKAAQGYVFGAVKDNDKKTHPCMVPFDQLPVVDRKKDELFRCIVITMADQVQP